MSACLVASFSRGFYWYSLRLHSIQPFDYRKIITPPYITVLTRCNEINPFTKGNDWTYCIITSEGESGLLIVIQNSILFPRSSSHRKKMIGIPNELMPGLPSSRMTLKVFYSESVAVLVNLCWRMRRPCVLSQVLNDATTSSVRTRVSSITMPPKPWLGFQLRYKNLILFVRVAKSRSRINRLGFIYSICWLREHSTPQQHFFQFSLNSIYSLCIGLQ